jgi:histidyl-tRNA synthetase
MPQIEPRTLKGFRDYLPEQMIPREALIDTARRVYRSYGFLPIDTPALEYEEILTGKGGGRRVAMRFDLTVPLARFVAQHSHELGLPFKRYHIAPVWRGENTQRGRFREFMQCDFDTIGTESAVSDIETVLVIHDLLRAIGIERFTIRINDRRYLTGVLEAFEFSDRQAEILRVLDKREKIGVEGVITEVGGLGFDASKFRYMLEYVDRQKLDLPGDPTMKRLAEVRHAVLATGVEPERVRFDPSIARGLDYYTGIVFETRLDDLPDIGSVCSGGRYDDLANLYTKERLPGIGASLGLDRLLAAMEELGIVEKRRATAPVFLPYFDEAHLADYLRLAARLRAAGVGVELYPEPKKLGAQLKYADRRGFKIALVLGENEWKSGRCQVKELGTGATRDVAVEDAAGALSPELLAALR